MSLHHRGGSPGDLPRVRRKRLQRQDPLLRLRRSPDPPCPSPHYTPVANKARAAFLPAHPPLMLMVSVGLMAPRGSSGSNQTLYWRSPVLAGHKLIDAPGSIVT